MSHPLSLAFLTVADIGPVEAIRLAAETGYAMVGLRLLPAAPGEPSYPLMEDDALLARARAALADSGVRVGDVEIVRLGPEPDFGLFARLCRRAGQLGARHVLVAGDDPEEARLTGSFARFAAMAHDHGLTADLEFMPWTAVPDLACARRVVEGAGHPAGGVLIDALHLDRAPTALAEVAAMPPGLIHYVQFCDGPVPYDPAHAALIAVARGARLFPGQGGIDLAGLARAIPPGTTVSIEVPNLGWAARLDPRGRALMARAATEAVLRAGGQASR